VDALAVLLIYLVPFFAIGIVAKKLVDAWMAKNGATLGEIQEQAGPNRRKPTRFLLGIWYRED
jgi:hypothetical protein